MNGIYSMARELEEAAKLSNDELGEWWSGLADILPLACSGSSEFQAAYTKELQFEYERLKQDFRIVESVETQKVTTRRLIHYTEE